MLVGDLLVGRRGPSIAAVAAAQPGGEIQLFRRSSEPAQSRRGYGESALLV